MHEKAHYNNAIAYGGAFKLRGDGLDIDLTEIGEEDKKEIDANKKEIRQRKLRIKLEKQKKVGIIPEELQRKDVDICFS